MRVMLISNYWCLNDVRWDIKVETMKLFGSNLSSFWIFTFSKQWLADSIPKRRRSVVDHSKAQTHITYTNMDVQLLWVALPINDMALGINVPGNDNGVDGKGVMGTMSSSIVTSND